MISVRYIDLKFSSLSTIIALHINQRHYMTTQIYNCPVQYSLYQYKRYFLWSFDQVTAVLYTISRTIQSKRLAIIGRMIIYRHLPLLCSQIRIFVDKNSILESYANLRKCFFKFHLMDPTRVYSRKRIHGLAPRWKTNPQLHRAVGISTIKQTFCLGENGS